MKEQDYTFLRIDGSTPVKKSAPGGSDEPVTGGSFALTGWVLVMSMLAGI